MEEVLTHEIELYPPESFLVLMEHEVNKSLRYKHPLTLVHLAVEANPKSPQTQHSAEVFAINVLNIQLRETDIPCKKGSEFMVLMASTDEQGGRVVCERLEKLFNATQQTYDRVSFELSAFIGMTSVDGNSRFSSNTLAHQAAAALQHAQSNHSRKAVIFSQIPE